MTKITQLPVASTISDTGVFVIVDEGVTKQLSWQTLRENGLKGEQGNTGTTGNVGPTGPTGTVATIAVGTVEISTDQTGSVTATTSTLSSHLTVLDFILPIGPKGDTGTYVPSIATSVVLGGVKIGAGVDITDDGIISVPAPTPYSLPIASSSVLGGVKVGTGITIDVDGAIHATTATQYVLPKADTVTFGGVKIGAGIGITDGVISVTTGAFALQTATNAMLGGVKIGAGIDVSSSGTISVSTSLSLASLLTGNTLASNVTSSNITSLGNLIELAVSGSIKIGQTAERFRSISSATGLVTHDCSSSTIFVHTTPSANFTANFINVSTSTNEVVSFALLINQSATPRIPAAVQVNSIPQTVSWQGGISPTGNANKVDLVNFTVFLTTGTNVVLGSLSSYG